MCVCVAIPFIVDVRLVDAPAKVTQDFSTFLLSEVVALNFIARRIQPSFFLLDRKVEFRIYTT